MRTEKRVQALSAGISGQLEGIQEGLLRRPTQSLFGLLSGPERWMVALGSAPCLQVETCTASERGPAAGKWRRIAAEAAYASLPQPPEWSVAESSGDWEDSVIMTEYARRLVLGLGHPDRPFLMVAGIPGYRRMAERYGPRSSQALEMLVAIDGLLAGLVDEMVTRQLNEQVTVVVTADAPVHESDPQRVLPDWWFEGELSPGIRSIEGQLYVESLAMKREVENGFVTLEISDSDRPSDPLNIVNVTLFDGEGVQQAQHFPDADGRINFASPNDRETYAVAQAEGFAPLTISNTELRR
jgi:hypothetical protein